MLLQEDMKANRQDMSAVSDEASGTIENLINLTPSCMTAREDFRDDMLLTGIVQYAMIWEATF